MEIPNINNFEELKFFLASQEKQITDLEEENKKLKENQKSIDYEEILNYIDERIPNLSIFEKNFFLRAFAIWGHCLAAQLIVSVIVGLIYLIIGALISGNI